LHRAREGRDREAEGDDTTEQDDADRHDAGHRTAHAQIQQEHSDAEHHHQLQRTDGDHRECLAEHDVGPGRRARPQPFPRVPTMLAEERVPNRRCEEEEELNRLTRDRELGARRIGATRQHERGAKRRAEDRHHDQRHDDEDDQWCHVAPQDAHLVASDREATPPRHRFRLPCRNGDR
jgi:hypothetical protein